MFYPLSSLGSELFSSVHALPVSLSPEHSILNTANLSPKFIVPEPSG